MFGNIYKTTWFGQPQSVGTGSSYYYTTGTGIQNGDFVDNSNWIFGAGWSVIDGECVYTPPGAQYSNLRQSTSFTNGDVVRISFNLTDNDTNGIYVRVQSGTWSPLITGTGWKIFDLTVGNTTNAQFEIGPGYATESVALDNIFIIPKVV